MALPASGSPIVFIGTVIAAGSVYIEILVPRHPLSAGYASGGFCFAFRFRPAAFLSAPPVL